MTDSTMKLRAANAPVFAVPPGYRLVGNAELAMVLGTLRRDEEDGRPVRGEMADNIIKSIARGEDALQALKPQPHGYIRPEDVMAVRRGEWPEIGLAETGDWTVPVYLDPVFRDDAEFAEDPTPASVQDMLTDVVSLAKASGVTAKEIHELVDLAFQGGDAGPAALVDALRRIALNITGDTPPHVIAGQALDTLRSGTHVD